MAWPHPITVLGFLAGFLAVLEILVILRVLAGDRATVATVATDVYHDRTGSTQATIDLAAIAVLIAGSFAGGLYPYFFHGLLGLPTTYHNALPDTLLTGALYGFLLFYAFIVLVVADLLPERLHARSFTFYLGTATFYGVSLGVFMGLSRGVWYPLLRILGVM